MKVHGSLDLLGNLLKNTGFAPDQNFPEDAQPGRFVFLDKRLYYCAELQGGIPFYIPLTPRLSMLRFTQSTPALEWSIPHDLGIAMPVVQVYDTQNKFVLPDEIDCSTAGTVLVKFNTPFAGHAILLGGEEFGAPADEVAYSQSFSSQNTWVITHGLGRNPEISCFINGALAIPTDIVYDSNTQATVTWLSPQSGVARCV